MPTLIVENTGVDHLYENGVPIAEVTITISELIENMRRRTASSTQADPFFDNRSQSQKEYSIVYDGNIRLINDYLYLGATDILPVFQPLQRWMGYFTDSEGDPISMFDYDILVGDEHTGTIVYRWQIMDTRLADYKMNYSPETQIDIITDLNIIRNVQRYLFAALMDYVLKELYSNTGHVRKAAEYASSYRNNRSYVKFWATSDLSLQTGSI